MREERENAHDQMQWTVVTASENAKERLSHHLNYIFIAYLQIATTPI
jgi:hypothetical protein